MTDAQDPPVTPEPAELTITEAAESAEVNPRTIRRRLASFPGAHRSGRSGSTGTWLIPKSDLVAAGFKLNEPREQRAEAANIGATDQAVELDAFRAELAEWRRRAEVAEARAEERERIIEAQAVALRALITG